jgi:hypothetical protein
MSSKNKPPYSTGQYRKSIPVKKDHATDPLFELNRDLRMNWFNNRTKTWVYVDAATFTDETALDYLPQIEPAFNLFKLYRKQGVSIVEAMKNVLEASLGINNGLTPRI